MLASCSENSWNDHLDGFEGGVNYNKVIEAEFTMSGADYTAVASNATNKSLAEAAGLSNALKAVGTNGLFSAEITAKEYLPAFLASSNAPYFLASEGSKVNVTYQETGVTDPIIAQVAGAQKYTVSKDDYISAWGSDKDYIDAFAPMTPAENKIPGFLKNAYPDAANGDLAIVSYNESTTNPIFISDSDVEEFIGGTFFLVADGANGAGSLAANKSYGYLPLVEMSVADGTVTASETSAFTFIPAAGGYYIKDVYGRFLYQAGTYNSFNVSATLPESGAVWTVDIASNGQATITNTEVGKWIQYDGGYSSWGSYSEAKGSLPVLYKAPAPKYYLVTEDGHGAGPVAADKGFGYLASIDMTVENGIVVGADQANAFTFEIAKEGYYIKDSYGRYLYQAGTYNNFNVTTDITALAEDACPLWTVTEDATGCVTITNIEKGKWIQYDGGYNSWGSYDSEKGALPKMYNAAASAPVASVAAKKVVAGTPVTATMNAVYKFDGGKWAPAEGVMALDAADYEAMGFAANKLDNADVYLPLFLKNNCQYAVEGDTMAVVYNGASCAVLVFDGTSWTINNNDLQTKTAQFVKNGNDWKFVKYVGKAYFNYTTELILDRAYLLVAEGICAIPTATSKTYGYMYTAPVNIVNGVIEEKNEVNAFTFASSAVVGDQEYKLGEGQFFIVDSNGRYSYMSGTYTSFNLADAPVVKDGAIDPAYIWTASCDSEGMWTINNAGNSKWIQYSSSYSSWGCYDVESGSLPQLYILAAE